MRLECVMRSALRLALFGLVSVAPSAIAFAAPPLENYANDRNYALERVKMIREKLHVTGGLSVLDDEWYTVGSAVSQIAGMWTYAAEGSAVYRDYVARQPKKTAHDPKEILESVSKSSKRYDAELDAEGQRIIDQFLRSGLPAMLDRLASAGPLVPTISVERPAIGHSINLRDVSRAAAFNVTRMSLARRRGDDAEFLRATRHNLAIGCAVSCEATLLGYGLGSGVERSTLKRIVEESLAEPFSPDTTKQLAILFDRSPGLDWATAMHCERLGLLDLTDWMYRSEGGLDSALGIGPKSTPAERAEAAAKKMQLASREETLAAIDAMLIPVIGELEGDPAASPEALRKSASLYQKLSTDESFQKKNIALTILMINLSSMQVDERDHRTLRSGVRTMLALECFKADKGHLPDSLDELVPAYLAKVPLDWLTPTPCNPIHYIKVDPAKDPLGREYLVYSVGRDGVDDQGKFDPAKPFRGLSGEGDRVKGYDYIINTTESLFDRK